MKYLTGWVFKQLIINQNIEKTAVLTLLVLFFTVALTNLHAQLDVENGPVKIYYPNGQVSSEGSVRDGKPDGYWKTYYVTGIIKSEGKRFNFLLDSTWKFYNQSGELTEIINYKLGKRSGYTMKYHYDNPDMPGQRTMISKELYINDKKEGVSSYYYNTGELHKEVLYAKGKKEGYEKEYNKEGTIITLNLYKDNYLISRERINRVDENGLKQGTYKTFYADGTVKEEINYLNDELHGYSREFDEEGKLLQSLRYERGAVMEEIDEEAKEIIDFKRTYDEQGRLVFTGGYKEGVPIGIHRFFDTTETVINAYTYNILGIKVSEGIVDEQGVRRGEWQDFYLDGSLRAKGNYRDNRRAGEWTFYFKNGKIEQRGSYLNGRLSGEWTWYYENGHVWRKEGYFNGREDGYCVEYDDKGDIIEEGNYINGEKDGKWIYEVGDHREEGNYIIGLKEGEWIHYYPSGNIKFEGNYVQGQLDGRQLYFYEDGTIKEEQYYSSGVRQRTWRKFDKEGNVLVSITYKDNEERRINGIKIRLPDDGIKVIN